MLTDKVSQLSREVGGMTKILDEFQDTHLIIKRPDNQNNDPKQELN